MIPELKLFTQRKGHYLGNADFLEVVVTGLNNVQDGDILRFEVKDIYGENNMLSRGTTIHKHIIPSSILTSLGVGDFIISVALNDVQQFGEVSYRVVPIPVIEFMNLAPDALRIPIREPISITGKWKIKGEEMNGINGSSKMLGLAANINQLN